MQVPAEAPTGVLSCLHVVRAFVCGQTGRHLASQAAHSKAPRGAAHAASQDRLVTRMRR